MIRQQEICNTLLDLCQILAHIFFNVPSLPSLIPQVSSSLLSKPPPSCIFPVTPHTKERYQNILYSWPQFPHTSDPSLICVSSSNVCSSCIFFGSASSSSGVGTVEGSVGNPSCIRRPISLHPLSVHIIAAQRRSQAAPTTNPRRHKRSGYGRKGGKRRTSSATVLKASHSTLGSTLIRSFGLSSISSVTSSQSFGWRGKLALEDLQAFTAQVRKLRVRSFIFGFSWEAVRGGGKGWLW